MDVSTEQVLAVYGETGDYGETARRTGLSYDAVRKRVRRNSSDPFPVIPGKSILYDAKTGDEKLVWATGKGAQGPSVAEIAEQVREALDGYKPPKALKTAPRATEKDLVTVYPLPDIHIGLLSWAKETGHNYDLKIAQDTLYPAVEGLVSGSPRSKQGVVLVLGDLLHSDNYKSETTKGTFQDTDGRYPKTLYAATQFVLHATDLALQKHDDVLVVVLPGNHDETSAVSVRLAVTLYYRNDKRVTVHDEAGYFWWWEWGKVFLGASHGDKTKMGELWGVMARDMPEAWGRTRYRHILTGHIHHERALEKYGAKVESLQSPVAPDNYHKKHGYGAGRSLQNITYHKERGEIMRQKVNL